MLSDFFWDDFFFSFCSKIADFLHTGVLWMVNIFLYYCNGFEL